MKRKLILLVSLIVGFNMNAFAENQVQLSAREVLARYSQMACRMEHVSMRICAQESVIHGSNPPVSHSETDLNVRRDGNNVDFFGTEKIFNPDGTHRTSIVQCHLFKEGRHYLAAKWPVGGKPLMAQIDKDDFEKNLCLFLNVPSLEARYGAGWMVVPARQFQNCSVNRQPFTCWTRW